MSRPRHRSFVSQRHRGIHGNRAPRWNQARNHRDHGQQQGDGDERGRIGCRNFVQRRFEIAREREGAGQSQRQADGQQDQRAAAPPAGKCRRRSRPGPCGYRSRVFAPPPHTPSHRKSRSRRVPLRSPRKCPAAERTAGHIALADRDTLQRCGYSPPACWDLPPPWPAARSPPMPWGCRWFAARSTSPARTRIARAHPARRLLKVGHIDGRPELALLAAHTDVAGHADDLAQRLIRHVIEPDLLCRWRFHSARTVWPWSD